MARALIKNPVLRGFNPDPSVIRVGDDYYIATSTFEWFPGVQIHHSRDLVHWNLLTRPLNRLSQLGMKGIPDSCGVWAPCLTHHGETFYLVYCNVHSFDGVWKDTHNYLVTSESIEGPWTDPIYLNSSGFDSSLFHDEDGKKWYLSMLVDHRGGKLFGGIILQEYSESQKKLVGPVLHIFEGTELGRTEGPHLYRKDNWYYLILAEGGTEYGHAVTLSRSRSITGPYELHPENPLVSTRDNPQHPLQKTGHADIFQTAAGEWYIAFLVGRPLSTLGRCTLGRETSIQKLIWEKDHWPRLFTGGREPVMEVEAPELPPHPFEPLAERDDFAGPGLDINWQSLRVPMTEDWLSLSERPGFLRLKGRESLTSLHEQSLVARRVQHFHIQVSTCLEFQPAYFQEMAGLVCYYNSSHYHYLYLSAGEKEGVRLLHILSCDKYEQHEQVEEPVKIPARGPVFLKVEFEGMDIRFFYALEEGAWNEIGPVLDGSILSDDYVREDVRYRPAFTGAFVGLCCQDLSGGRRSADFAWFDYKELGSAAALAAAFISSSDNQPPPRAL